MRFTEPTRIMNLPNYPSIESFCCCSPSISPGQYYHKKFEDLAFLHKCIFNNCVNYIIYNLKKKKEKGVGRSSLIKEKEK